MKRVSAQEFYALAVNDLRGLFNAIWSGKAHRDDDSAMRADGFAKWISEGDGRRALDEKLELGLLWDGEDWVASPAYEAAVARLEQASQAGLIDRAAESVTAEQALSLVSSLTDEQAAILASAAAPAETKALVCPHCNLATHEPRGSWAAMTCGQCGRRSLPDEWIRLDGTSSNRP
jgi:hypothetical protein